MKIKEKGMNSKRNGVKTVKKGKNIESKKTRQKKDHFGRKQS